MKKTTAKKSAAKTIKAAICPNGPAKKAASPAPMTMADVLSAFNRGLGIRKVNWSKGYFVYLLNGVITGGQLASPCREDKTPSKDITFGNDASIWEIVTPEYSEAFKLAAHRDALRALVVASVSNLAPVANAAQVAAIAKILKVSVPVTAPC